MLPEFDIPLPFRYNPLKHHRLSILVFIKSATNEIMKDWAKLVQSNYIDIYTGLLSPIHVCDEIAVQLNQQKIQSQEHFLGWVHKDKPYKILKLSDHSEWVLRKGDDNVRYIHIHPSRTGEFTLRFKGTTLLTAYKLHQKFKTGTFMPLLEHVNEAREEMNLSPVKRLDHDKGILKCWRTVFS